MIKNQKLHNEYRKFALANGCKALDGLCGSSYASVHVSTLKRIESFHKPLLLSLIVSVLPFLSGFSTSIIVPRTGSEDLHGAPVKRVSLLSLILLSSAHWDVPVKELDLNAK